MKADPKRKPDQSEYDRSKRARRQQEEALDDALKNTFPASDPFSIEQPGTAGQRQRHIAASTAGLSTRGLCISATLSASAEAWARRVIRDITMCNVSGTTSAIASGLRMHLI